MIAIFALDAPKAVLDLLHRGTVRVPMLIEAQAAIERAILQGAERTTRFFSAR